MTTSFVPISRAIFPTNAQPYSPNSMAMFLLSKAPTNLRDLSLLSRYTMHSYVHKTKQNNYIGSHNRSFKGIINCLAKARVASYETAHLNMGGPSNRSLGEVRNSNLIDVSSIICEFMRFLVEKSKKTYS